MREMLPRIGITTSYEAGEQRLSHAYVRAIEKAGGLPLIAPMMASEEGVRVFAALLDALVITGGPAITDGLIGSLPKDLAETDPIRLAADKRMLAAFLASRKPVLGICYGMQLLNAASGGTIYADIQKQQSGSLIHSDKRGAASHRIRPEPGTVLQRVFGPDDLVVNSRHIQAVAEIGKDFRIAATAPDGVVEAIESADGRLLGVQFHPERMDETCLPLFQYLVQRARR